MEVTGVRFELDGIGAALAGIGRWNASLDGVAAHATKAGAAVGTNFADKIAGLTSKISLQERSLSVLGQELEALSKKEGVSALAIEKKKLAYDRAAASLDNNKRQLKTLQSALEHEQRGTQDAAKATDHLGQELGQSAPQANILATAISRASASATAAVPQFSALDQIVIGGLRRIGAAAVEAGAFLGRELVDGIGSSINMAGDFEATVTRFAAVTGDALAQSGQDVQDFNDLFLKLGADTQYSAQQAAEAGVNLAKGGIDPATVAAGGLSAALTLASAGELDLAQAADLTAKQYGVWAAGMDNAADRAAFLSQSSDRLAQAANASTVGVQELGLGLAQVSQVARTMGYDFDETVTVMAQLAPAFGSASDAGTSWKAVINNLIPTTKDAKQTMRELGLYTTETGSAFFDAQGNFVGARAAADLLATATHNLSEEQKSLALETIFGSDGQRAAALIAEQGAAGYDRMRTAMDGAGTASEQAAARQVGLNFAMEQLGGSVETLQIVLGQKLIPYLLPLIDLATQGTNVLLAFAQGSDDAGTQLYGFVHAIDEIIPGFQNFFYAAQDTLSWLGGLASDAYAYGSGIAVSFADGIISAVSFIVDAMNAIGDTIAYWLEPHSPPNILPDLDQWGAGAMQVYLDGWGAADYSIFQEIGGVISSELRSIAETAGSNIPRDGLIPMILGTRTAVAAALNQLRETGTVGAEAFDRIRAAAGPAGETIVAYTEQLIDVAQATAAVTEAQADLDSITSTYDGRLDDLNDKLDITKGSFEDTLKAMRSTLNGLETALESAKNTYDNTLDGISRALEKNERQWDGVIGGLEKELEAVNSQFNEQLSPIDQQLAAIDAQEKAIDQAEELAKLQETLNDSSATEEEKRKASLKIQRIQLENERDRIKLEQQQAVDPIEQQIKEAERQKQVEQDRLQQRMDAVKRERDTVVRGIQDQIKAQQKQIDVVEQQRDAEVERIQAQIDATKAQRDLEVEAAKARLEAAQQVEDAATAELDARKAAIDVQHEQNSLSNEQRDILKAIADEQERAAKAAEKAAKAGGGKKAGGGGKVKKPDMPLIGRPQGAPRIGGAGEGDDPLSQIEAAAERVTTKIQTAREQTALAVEEIVLQKDKMVSAFGEMGLGVGQALAGIGTVIAVTVLPGVLSATGAFLAAVVPLGILAAAGAGLYTAWETNFLGIRDVADIVFNGIGATIGTFIDNFSTAREAGFTFLESISIGLTSAGGTFSNVLPGMGEAVSAFAGRALELIGDLAGRFGVWLGEMAERAGAWILDSLPDLGKNLGRFTGAFLGWAATFVVDMLIWAGKAALTMYEWIRTDVQPNLPIYLAKIGEGFYNFMQGLLEGLIPYVADLGLRFLTWVDDAVLPYLADKLYKIYVGIRDWIVGSLVGIGQSASQIGVSMVEGIQAGISAAWQSFINWVNRKIDEIPQAIRDALGIGSPSKVMADQVGQWLPAGIALGIEDNAGVIQQAFNKAMMPILTRPPGIAGVSAGTVNNTSLQNNYNLQVLTNQSPQVVTQSYGMMRLMTGG